MNSKTQKLVFSKIQNQKLGLKKQKFGAIEDAIKSENDSFNQDAGSLKLYMDELSILATEIEDTISELKNKFNNLLSQIDKKNNDYIYLVNRSVELEKYDPNFGGDWLMLEDLWEGQVERAYDLSNSLNNIN